MNLNKVMLVGRIAADPETRNTPSGQNISTIRMATNRVWVDRGGQKQEQAEFHTVVCWGKLAEIVDKYVKRGQMVYIEGRLQTRSWQTNDGQKRYRTEIVAESLQMGPKASGTAQMTSGQSYGGQTSAPAKMNDIKEEDIPVINQDLPTHSSLSGEGEPVIHDDVEESQIDLKDIPF